MRCWAIPEEFDGEGGARAQQAASIFLVDGEDLIIQPGRKWLWSASAPAPYIYRPIGAGQEFLAITPVEATSGGDRCMESNQEAAGFVVVPQDAGSEFEYITYMSRPEIITDDEFCGDEVPDPTPAVADVIAYRRGSGAGGAGSAGGAGGAGGAGADVIQLKTPMGYDGEADIAVCRSGNELTFFYRAVGGMSSGRSRRGGTSSVTTASERPRRSVACFGITQSTMRTSPRNVPLVEPRSTTRTPSRSATSRR